MSDELPGSTPMPDPHEKQTRQSPNESGRGISQESEVATGRQMDVELPSESPADESGLDETVGDEYPAECGADEDEQDPPPRRNLRWPLILFAATCVSTFWAGTSRWAPQEVLAAALEQGSAAYIRLAVLEHGWDGLVYMTCVMTILLLHEMGHFLATILYRVPASWPYFLPVPVPSGTMGAVIRMDGMRANRREIFDIGIAGPLAGLVAAIPVLYLGLLTLNPPGAATGPFALEMPRIACWMLRSLHPETYSRGAIFVPLSQVNPLLMAGWLGMLVTGLNMLPLSQLDGGHVLHGLTPRYSARIARGALLWVIVYVVFAEVWGQWMLMLGLVVLMGVDHPPTANDRVPIGYGRTILGLVSLLIPYFCLPVQVVKML